MSSFFHEYIRECDHGSPSDCVRDYCRITLTPLHHLNGNQHFGPFSHWKSTFLKYSLRTGYLKNKTCSACANIFETLHWDRPYPCTLTLPNQHLLPWHNWGPFHAWMDACSHYLAEYHSQTQFDIGYDCQMDAGSHSTWERSLICLLVCLVNC